MTFKDIPRCPVCGQLMWWTKNDVTGQKDFFCNTCTHMSEVCEGDCDVCVSGECKDRECEMSMEAMMQ